MAKEDKLKTLIVDNDPSDVQSLVKHLKGYAHIEVAGVCYNAEKGLMAMKELQPDLLFLDVEMPDMTGLDFIEHLDTATRRQCKIVVYTAYADYMLEALRKHAVDFLLKPIDTDDLDGIIQRINLAKDEELADGRIFKPERSILMFINVSDFRLVRLKDIGVFRYNSIQRVWEAIVAHLDKPVKLKRSVNNRMLLALDPMFVQVHQKYIVNINSLTQVNNNMCVFLPPFDDIDYVTVGSSYRKKLMNLFINM